jgi:hypothetical protein
MHHNRALPEALREESTRRALKLVFTIDEVV